MLWDTQGTKRTELHVERIETNGIDDTPEISIREWALGSTSDVISGRRA